MNNKSLDSIFDIESSTTSSEIEKVADHDNLQPVSDVKNDIKNDYKYSRSNIYSIIEKGQEAINGALELAQETESPRAYEVTGQLIKNVADSVEKLLDLQKKFKDIQEIKDIRGPSTINNALFVGSTADLTKLIKSQKNNIDDK